MDPETVTVRLEEFGIEYKIRVFKDSEELTRSDGIYECKEGFDLVVVQRCVEDFGNLSRSCDTSGYSAQKSPKAIIAEIAENCLDENPHFRRFWVSGPGKVEKPDFGEISAKLAENAKTAKTAKERNDRIADLERKTLKSAKKTIWRIFDEMSNSEIAEELDIPEIGIEVLKSRNWTFWDCLSIAEKLGFDIEVAFGRFRTYREGKEDQ